ncbi:MAG: hypothetical protein ACREAE_05365 [Nitrosopumilaceae archaeon]
MTKKPVTKKQEKHTAKIGKSSISWLIFLATLVVVLISLTTVLFPSLVIRSASAFQDTVINPYETGVWTYPLLAANFVLLAIGILYFKNKLPPSITNPIKFIFNFEVSKKTAFIVVIIILAIYVILSAGELATEETWEDYTTIGETGTYQATKDRAAGWNINQVIDAPSEPHFRYMLLNISLKIFGNVRVIPFIASIALLVLTYYITKEIAKNRFAGIVSMIVLLQSATFLTYDTSAIYDNFWILLYLLSLYLIYKKWSLSPVSYILSIPSKALTAMFLPMSLFFIYRANIPRQKKIRTAISYGVIIALGIAALSVVNISGKQSGFDANDFWRGFTSWAFQLRFDGIVLIFLLPLVMGLFIASRRGMMQADSIMVLILGMLLSAPFLQGLTDFTNQPYRFVPLIVFFAMGVGTILSKKTSEQV